MKGLLYFLIFILVCAVIILWKYKNTKKTTSQIFEANEMISTKKTTTILNSTSNQILIDPQAKMFGVNQYTRNLLLDFDNDNQVKQNIFLGSGFYSQIKLKNNKLELILGEAFLHQNSKKVYNFNGNVWEGELKDSNGCVLFPLDTTTVKPCQGIIQIFGSDSWRIPAFKNIECFNCQNENGDKCCQEFCINSNLSDVCCNKKCNPNYTECCYKTAGFKACTVEQYKTLLNTQSSNESKIRKLIPYSTINDTIRGGLVLFAKNNVTLTATFFGYFQIQAYATSDKLVGKNLELWTGIQWATLYPALETYEQTLKMPNPVYFNYPCTEINKSRYTVYQNFKSLFPDTKLIRIRLCAPEALFEEDKYFKYNTEKISYVLFSPKLFNISDSEPLFTKIFVNSLASNIDFQGSLPSWVKIPSKISIVDPRAANKILYQAYFPEKIYEQDKCRIYSFSDVKDDLIKLRNFYSDYECIEDFVNKSKALDFTQNFPQMFFEDNPNKNYVLFWTGEHPKTGQVFDPRLLEPMYLYDSITRIITMKNTKR